MASSRSSRTGAPSRSVTRTRCRRWLWQYPPSRGGLLPARRWSRVATWCRYELSLSVETVFQDLNVEHAGHDDIRNSGDASHPGGQRYTRNPRLERLGSNPCACLRHRMASARCAYPDALTEILLCPSTKKLLWLDGLIALMAFGFGGCARVHAMAPA